MSFYSWIFYTSACWVGIFNGFWHEQVPYTKYAMLIPLERLIAPRAGKALKLKGCHIISYIILPVSSCCLHVCPSSLFVCYLVLYSELVIKVHRSALRLDCRTMVSNQCTGWMILSYSTLQSDSIYTIWQHSLFRSTNRMSSTYAEHAKGSRQPGWNIFIFYFLHNGHKIKWLLNV